MYPPQDGAPKRTSGCETEVPHPPAVVRSGSENGDPKAVPCTLSPAVYGYSVLIVALSVLFIPVRCPICESSPRRLTMVGRPLLENAVGG